MAKVRFDNLSLGAFSNFKFVTKKKVIKHDNNKRITTNLIKGVCIKEDDDFKIKINVKHLKPDIIDDSKPDIITIEFTEESYTLRGVISVFDRNPNKDGKYTRYIRSETKAKFFPGSSDRYVPFCRNWVCSGHIVKRDGKLMFDFNECISPLGYTTLQIENE